MVYQTEKTLQDMGDKLDSADKSEVEAKLSALKSALQGSDVEVIKSTTEDLTQAFYKVSEKLYQQPQGQPGYDAGAGAEAAGGGAEAGGGQQYYDADYEVVDDDKK